MLKKNGIAFSVPEFNLEDDNKEAARIHPVKKSSRSFQHCCGFEELNESICLFTFKSAVDEDILCRPDTVRPSQMALHRIHMLGPSVLSLWIPACVGIKGKKKKLIWSTFM